MITHVLYCPSCQGTDSVRLWGSHLMRHPQICNTFHPGDPRRKSAMSTTVLTPEPSSPTLDALLAWLRQQRAAGSVHYDAQQQLWQVFGYADVLRVLTDSAAFSSDFRALLPSQPDFALFAKGNFVRMDPPKHRQLRSLVTQ